MPRLTSQPFFEFVDYMEPRTPISILAVRSLAGP